MIIIVQNPNFAKFFQVFAFGKLIDEVNRKSRAIRLAKGIAKDNNVPTIFVEGEPTEV
jgi:hypothetical protein